MKDLFSIAGKVALVTGGSSGIGRMIAQGYLEAGARLYIASRKLEPLQSAAAELGAFGPCTAIAADLSSADGAHALAQELARREPQLHVLVNNAGANWAAPLEEYPESGWDKVMDLNLKGAFYLTQALLPLLRRAASPLDPARIINVASIDGMRVPSFETYAYAASKAGLLQLTRVLARRLAREQLTVNALAPGPFPSKMMRATLERSGSEIAASIPLGRIGTAEDIAGAAIYLASRAGAYLTGTALPVDGGLHWAGS
jgi:NAD(P)-dependent dehydrogenase (short-subunit alcohol dehydrogenase family)